MKILESSFANPSCWSSKSCSICRSGGECQTSPAKVCHDGWHNLSCKCLPEICIVVLDVAWIATCTWVKIAHSVLGGIDFHEEFASPKFDVWCFVGLCVESLKVRFGNEMLCWWSIAPFSNTHVKIHWLSLFIIIIYHLYTLQYASIIFARLGLHLFADVMARNSLKGLDFFQLLIEYEYELYSIHVTYFFLHQALANPTLIFETGESGKFSKLPHAGQIKHASFSYRKLNALLIYIPVRERPTSDITRTIYNDGHDTFQIFKLLADVTVAKHSDIIVTSGPGGSSDAGLGVQLLHLGDKLRLESSWFSFQWVP